MELITNPFRANLNLDAVPLATMMIREFFLFLDYSVDDKDIKECKQYLYVED